MPNAHERNTVFFVSGSTHIDLAWKKSRGEHAEMYESEMVQLLDILDHDPDYAYTLEQAAHLRALEARRPDLIGRLKRYLRTGRLEMLGGSASLVETNFPCGESFVRNQKIGMDWVRENLGATATTGWLIDTFGLNAQIPQILRQFGISRLIANRFGGDVTIDRFQWKGLDGSRLNVIGQDCFCPVVKTESLVFRFFNQWSKLKAMFAEARRLKGGGPFLVMPYTENETGPFRCLSRLVRQENAAGARRWRMALPREFFDALESANMPWPTLGPDLNPEFTGTFSNRIVIRLRNRFSEFLLLEAEKWAALLGADPGETLRHAWWEMSFNQFHDVLTGSHPTEVLEDVLATYDRIDRASHGVLEQAFALAGSRGAGTSRRRLPSSPRSSMAIVFNGLPWDRTDCLRFACSGHPPARIWNGQAPVAFEIDGESVLALAQAPSVGHSILEIEHGEGETPKAAARAVRSATIENERIRVLCDAAGGIRAIFGKDAGEEFLAATGALLVAQEDRGHFQIESPVNAEIPASAGSVSLLRRDPTPVRSRLALRGEFPALPWAGSDSHLKWEMELALYPAKNRLDMALRIDWKGEATRIRLKIPSNIDAAGGLFEIPFGVVERKPYRERGTARGEWPAMRFAAIETHDRGLALANTGVAGVEIAGGTLWTTLLRAPGSDSSNLVRDATSSQHGTHEFRFALVPYAGKDRRTEAIAAAQELNSPLLHSMRPCASGSANIGADSLRRSFLALSPSSVVLSSIKAPDDGAKEIAVRMYETMGVRTQAELSVPGAIRAWRSNLAEKKGKAVSCHNGKMAIAMKPFEIVTIRIALDSALAHP